MSLLWKNATLPCPLKPAGHAQAELVLEGEKLLPFDPAPSMAQKLHDRSLWRQKRAGKPITGFLFVNVCGQTPRQQQVPQLMCKRESLPVARPTGRHRNDWVRPSIGRACGRREPREPRVRFIDNDHQQTQGLQGACQITDRIEAKPPGLSHLV